MELIWQGFLHAVLLILRRDPEVMGIMWLSLGVSAIATVLSLLLGIPLGTVVGLSRFPGRGLVLSLVNTGMGFPPVV